MKNVALRKLCSSAFGLALAACGAGDGPAPLLPTSAGGGLAGGTTLISGVGTPDRIPQVAMESSVGALPQGFVPLFRSDPRPDADGVIRGDSPLTVKFDLCGSRADAGKTLFYLYDWDFDHVPEVVGSGDACEQEHQFRIGRNATDGDLAANLCVVNGDPLGPDRQTLFFSCRAYRVSLPVPAPEQSVVGCINNPKWMPVTCTTSRWVWSSNRAIATSLAAANLAHVLETGCNHTGFDQPALSQGLCSLDGTGWVSTQTFIMSGCNASWYHIGGSFTGNCAGHDGDTTRHLVLGVNDCFDY